MNFFSIVIPCHNAAATLPATLDAIRAQTFSGWEVLCIDDGSSDKTRAVIENYASMDRRIRGWSTNGVGPSRARNTLALSWAAGNVLAFCDADDIWSANKLAQLDACFADQTVDGVYGQIAFFTDTPEDSRAKSNVPVEALSIPMLLAENPVCTMSNFAVRTKIFHATEGFDETMVHNEDLDWLIRLVAKGAKIVGLNTLQTYYRNTPYGLSSDLNAMKIGRRMAIETAARFGYIPTAAADAMYYRYLARRALRLGHGRTDALGLAIKGIFASPRGFFNSPKRGALTFLGALSMAVLPHSFSRTLFA